MDCLERPGRRGLPEVQAVPWRSGGRVIRADDFLPPDAVAVQRTSLQANRALLPHKLDRSVSSTLQEKRVASLRNEREGKIDLDADRSWTPRRPSPKHREATPPFYSLSDGAPECVPEKAQPVEQTRLSRTVRAHYEGQRAEAAVARPDASVAPQGQSRDEHHRSMPSVHDQLGSHHRCVR
jgi:hypothetical protein